MKIVLLAALCVAFSGKIYAGPQLIVSTAEESAIQEISLQVLEEAYAEIGYELQVIRTSNARSLRLANDGRTDGEVSRVRGIENEFNNLVRVPVAVNVLDIRAFTNKPEIRVADWESLRGYSLICVKGSKFVERNLAARKIDCYHVTQFAQAIYMLSAGRGDIALLPEVNGLQAIKDKKLSNRVVMGESLHKAGLYHYLHKKNAALLPKIESALERMRERGRIKQIRTEYLNSQMLQTISLE